MGFNSGFKGLIPSIQRRGKRGGGNSIFKFIYLFVTSALRLAAMLDRSRVLLLPGYVFCAQTQNIEPSAQILSRSGRCLQAAELPWWGQILACWEEILKEKKRALAGQTSVIRFLKLSWGTVTPPPVLLDAGDGDLGDSPVVQEEVPPPKFSFVYFIFFVNFS